MAHSLDEIQLITYMFSQASEIFRLTINIKKTEDMYQPAPHKSYINPFVYMNSILPKSVENFCYLESIFSNLVNINDEVAQWIARSRSSLECLDEHSVRLRTKRNVYKPVIVNTLLYGCET